MRSECTSTMVSRLGKVVAAILGLVGATSCLLQVLWQKRSLLNELSKVETIPVIHIFQRSIVIEDDTTLW